MGSRAGRRRSPKKTRGAQMLAAYLAQGHRQEDVAAEVSRVTGRRVHQSSVSNWASWRHMPQGACMAALQRLYGIPIDAWMQPALPEPSPDEDDEEVPRARKTGTEG